MYDSKDFIFRVSEVSSEKTFNDLIELEELLLNGEIDKSQYDSRLIQIKKGFIE